MKAYQVWDTMSVENCSTVVFAENGKEDRQALVRLGWMCLDTGEECDTCPVREFCGHWEGEDEEE